MIEYFSTYLLYLLEFACVKQSQCTFNDKVSFKIEQ